MTILGFFAAPTVAGLTKGKAATENKRAETKTRVMKLKLNRAEHPPAAIQLQAALPLGQAPGCLTGRVWRAIVLHGRHFAKTQRAVAASVGDRFPQPAAKRSSINAAIAAKSPRRCSPTAAPAAGKADSVNVPQVLFVGFELLDPCLGVLAGFAALLLADGDQCLMDVLGHARGIAANIKHRAVAEP